MTHNYYTTAGASTQYILPACCIVALQVIPCVAFGFPPFRGETPTQRNEFLTGLITSCRRVASELYFQLNINCSVPPGLVACPIIDSCIRLHPSCNWQCNTCFGSRCIPVAFWLYCQCDWLCCMGCTVNTTTYRNTWSVRQVAYATVNTTDMQPTIQLESATNAICTGWYPSYISPGKTLGAC